ncbi:thioredoxin [Mobilicoccus massiliensis]|uniref:thioredoxin n=1 Tax=Mobilicoccus massiliensis TaxID=1522310 RepID=UPI0009E3688D|nr:thioredoxin [Mobilicoccus massiliensis]
MTTIALTGRNFDETMASAEIVLIDFWASWCGPCRNFAPIFEASSEKNPDITYAKVDTDAEQELAAAANITSIPTVMAIRQGIPVFAQPGALPAEALEDVIAQVRALDMGEVRAQYEAAVAQQAGAEQPAGQQDPTAMPATNPADDRARADSARGVDRPDDNGAIV